jgi:hypothetical protein
MKIEIEMTTELTDVSEILQKVTLVVNAAKEEGFNIQELLNSSLELSIHIFSYANIQKYKKF